MRITSINKIAAAVVSIAAIATASVASAQDLGPRAEVSLMGGVQALNRNDTALPDNIVNVPAVATVTYPLTRLLAAEGEFTWLIPVEQSLDLGSGTTQNLKTPDILAYHANLKASWPISGTPWTPYLVAGPGAVTFLSNQESGRIPALAQSQTMFAVDFGTGVSYGLNSSWAVRADFRELVAFPSKDTEGLSSAGNADPIWMERGTLGLSYRF